MRFSEYIKPYVQEELAKAGARRAQGDAKSAFVHLENAHVLGQASTKWHTIAHWNMLKWGVKNRDGRETVGQILRIIGALTKTALGLVPIGNTGGADISPFKPLPIRKEHAAVLDAAPGA